MNPCMVCESVNLVEGLNLGLQPVSNRFQTPEMAVDRFPLALGQCEDCGTVQLTRRMPVAELRPRVPWLKYNEPEEHLDELVRRIGAHLPAGGTACGLSYKDSSLLERLAGTGWHLKHLDLAADLGLSLEGAGVESIQAAFDRAAAQRFVARAGQVDLVLVRHVLEHVYDWKSFFEGLGELVRPDGVIVFEVPDCTKAFSLFDYSLIWEEHLCYFTPPTLAEALATRGFVALDIYVHPYAFENSLMAICRRGNSSQAFAGELESELMLGREYFSAFADKSRKLRERLEQLGRERGPIALFGAGHLSTAFICYHGLESLIDCVLDDNLHKQGLCQPGTRILIKPSSELATGRVRNCLLGINLSAEERVIATQKKFAESGGEFWSIFAGSKRALI